MLSFAEVPNPPSRYPKPLGGSLTCSDGPRLLALLDRVLVGPDGSKIRLDPWQAALINHLLERYPKGWPDPLLAGRLRWRRSVTSMGRQNGKSVIGGALALYGLLQHSAEPNVIGVATSIAQANIVYSRVQRVVDASPDLSRLLIPSGTRGIRWRDGRGTYSVKPSKESGLQGLPVSAAVADELHIMRPEVWRALVNGQRSVPDSFVAGITTAGDCLSSLLKELYAAGAASMDDPAARFGLFVWEAPDDEFTIPNILAANPAVSCGRIPIERVLADTQGLPAADRVRYTLNRFISGSESWFNSAKWAELGDTARGLPDGDPVAIGIDRGASWSWVSWVGVWRADEGLYAARIARVNGMDQARAAETTIRLAEAFPTAAIAAAGRRMSSLVKACRAQGLEGWAIADIEAAQAAEDLLARIGAGSIRHDGGREYAIQISASRRKIMTDGSWMMVPGAAGMDVAGALISALACAGKRREPAGLQLF